MSRFLIFIIIFSIVFVVTKGLPCKLWRGILHRIEKRSTNDGDEDRTRYDSRYPLTDVITNEDGSKTYRIGIIADLDKASKIQINDETIGETAIRWKSLLKKGNLTYDSENETSISIVWDEEPPLELISSYSDGKRGMEFSELITYNGRLLTFDDRTGNVHEILNETVQEPWLTLKNIANGTRGFKSEWATVKDEHLYVGTTSKQWINLKTGAVMHNDLMYIKEISDDGQVKHLNWENQYKKLLSALQLQLPGYLTHESGVWSDKRNKWFFMPRKCSANRYSDENDMKSGCSKLLIADENFNDIQTIEIGVQDSERGVSSFKFIPNTEDQVIVALKTIELMERIETFITVFKIDGTVLVEDQKIANDKYEGFEFI